MSARLKKEGPSPRVVTAVVFSVALAGAAAARPPSLEGKWRLNLAESEMLPGEVSPTELVMTITEDDAKGFRWTVTAKMRGGQGGTIGFAGAIDGRSYPVQGRPGSTSSFSWTQGGALKQVSESQGGVSVETCSISPDAKRMMCDVRQTDSTGRAASYAEVFDRL